MSGKGTKRCAEGSEVEVVAQRQNVVVVLSVRRGNTWRRGGQVSVPDRFVAITDIDRAGATDRDLHPEPKLAEIARVTVVENRARGRLHIAFDPRETEATPEVWRPWSGSGHIVPSVEDKLRRTYRPGRASNAL